MAPGNMWELKNTIEGFRIFQMICNAGPTLPWKLFIRGEQPNGESEMMITAREQILKNSRYSNTKQKGN
jgi:hypothetical protein